jgi:thiol-disulfide isomerase/thioredoxin
VDSGTPPAAAATPLVLEVARFPSGQPYRLSEDKGNVVLLDVWATWCEVCVDSLPAYDALLREYAAKGLKGYAMSVDEDRNMVELFVKTMGLDLPILLDLGAQIAEGQLGLDRLPTTLVIDKRGVVRFVHAGFESDSLPRLRAELDALLAEPEV